MYSLSNNKGGRGRGRGDRNQSKKSSTSATSASKTKSLKDYVYDVGSAKHASDCVTTTNFLINHIRMTYSQGEDIATA